MMRSTELESDMSARTAEDGYILSLRDVLPVIRRRLWIISLVAVVLTGAAVGFSVAQTPMYEASIKILVGQERGTSEAPIGVYDLQQLTLTMVGGVSSRPVAEAVIRQQDLRMTPKEFLEEHLTVEQEPETQWIQVSYRDSNPERAQRVANAVGDVFSKRVSEVSPSANAITATVWERAVVPDEIVSPNPLRNGFLALALGLMIGAGLAFFVEYLDDSWRSPEEMEQISGATTFGIIPEIKDHTSQKGAGGMGQALLKTRRQVREKADTDELAGHLVSVLDPMSAATEAYRSLRTNLLYAAVLDERPKVIVLTSPGQGEGKSTTCANLGVVLAQAGKEVLIVDCDFRKPVMHRFFGLRNLYGIVEVLIGERQLQEVWKQPMERLHVINVGRIPPNPTELLSTRRFAEFLASFREKFDYVLVDAPPIGLVSDAAILATQGDGILFVADAQNTRKGSVRQAIRSLKAVGANVLGTVMNNVKIVKSSYSYYATYYTYGSEPE
jgi:capsular exopolysaccharide synthesis family protein